jgi:hypothetical protein
MREPIVAVADEFRTRLLSHVQDRHNEPQEQTR